MGLRDGKFMNMTTIEESTPVIEQTPQAIETITLRVENGRWVAEYSSPGVGELWGTSRIPTAWDSGMSAEEVRGRMEDNWPEMKVVVEGRP